ncbi:glycosyltransferase family 39 protein [Hymenobacter sp. YC55]|uniref:glycosyltransferase family 39 protein n=1 Tax=Hymenobacter sp. YC55 TaxID=3034019 RepID=UPI0023F826ED|nr:glycosyltransferase family 39 protein [Hymenobacter sp. YC55]MDF7813862.1 glycosyltransferase family 39 protein [Hymenobacter sp. YC55]
MLAQLRSDTLVVPTRTPSAGYALATGLLLLVGIGLRLFHYFYNRSLWTDEIYLNAGIVDLSFQELLQGKPLPYLQKAPLGYLLSSHLFVVLFGNSELALRLFSLLTGIASLFLLVPVTRYFLRPFGALVALALLALATPLIYHAVEAKPYGTDLMVTLLLLWLYGRYRYATSWADLLRWGLGGSLAVWFSYPSIFVLAGMALVVGGEYLLKRQGSALRRVSLPFSMWLVSFALSYFLYAKPGSEAGWLVFFFYKYDGYVPLQPVAGAVWLLKKAVVFFHTPLGLTWWDELVENAYLRRFVQRMTLVPVLLAGAGMLYFWRADKRYLVLLAGSLLLVVAASALHRYPFYERMVVFLAPFVILLLAAGSEYLRHKSTFLRYAGYGLTVLLLAGALKNAVAQTLSPYLLSGYKMSYYRDALQFVRQHYRAGDGVYVYWNAAAGYTFYKAADALPFSAVVDPDRRYELDNYPAYFARVDADLYSAPNPKRVWVIYSGVDMNQGDYGGQPAWYYQGHDFREGYGVEQLTKHLQQIGTVRQRYVPTDGNPNPDVRVLLLELR